MNILHPYNKILCYRQTTLYYTVCGYVSCKKKDTEDIKNYDQ